MTNLKKIHLAHKNMLDRCYNPKNASFTNYGGRGITVCDEWKTSRDEFVLWAIAAGHADDLSLDRIDNNKGYSPENCRWASIRDQLLNQRRNRIIEFGGVALALSQWAEKLGITLDTLSKRLVRMPVEKALQPGRLTEWKHGTRHGYQKGCRCDLCRAANAEHQRDLRSKRKAKRSISSEKFCEVAR